MKEAFWWALATCLEIKLFIYIITALDFKTSPKDLGTPNAFLMHYVFTHGLHFLSIGIISFPSSKRRCTIVSIQLLCLTWKIRCNTANVSMLGNIQYKNLVCKKRKLKRELTGYKIKAEWNTLLRYKLPNHCCNNPHEQNPTITFKHLFLSLQVHRLSIYRTTTLKNYKNVKGNNCLQRLTTCLHLYCCVFA